MKVKCKTKCFHEGRLFEVGEIGHIKNVSQHFVCIEKPKEALPLVETEQAVESEPAKRGRSKK